MSISFLQELPYVLKSQASISPSHDIDGVRVGGQERGQLCDLSHLVARRLIDELSPVWLDPICCCKCEPFDQKVTLEFALSIVSMTRELL